jgi:2-pyrone-4,6-dicarboxylate lactonase
LGRGNRLDLHDPFRPCQCRDDDKRRSDFDTVKDAIPDVTIVRHLIGTRHIGRYFYQIGKLHPGGTEQVADIFPDLFVLSDFRRGQSSLGIKTDLSGNVQPTQPGLAFNGLSMARRRLGHVGRIVTTVYAHRRTDNLQTCETKIAMIVYDLIFPTKTTVRKLPHLIRPLPCSFSLVNRKTNIVYDSPKTKESAVMTPEYPEPTCPGPIPEPRSPRKLPPDGSWDCHAHVFGPAEQFAYVTPRAYTPPDASLHDYLAVLDILGFDHGVLLQPSIYGKDNSCLLNALSESKGRLRGVVDIDPRTLDTATVEDWTGLGICGVRLNMMSPIASSLADVESIGACLKDFGWHLSLLVDRPDRLTEIEPTLNAIGCKIIIEQMGRMKANLPLATPGFQTLLRLLSDGKIWVKLSHAYHISTLGRPPYEDTMALARACIEAAPDRAVWGSDWPHALMHGPMPDDGFLLDLFDEWIGDRNCRNQILVTNPADFYGSKILP